MLLSDLQNGEQGVISKVMGRGAFRKRITEMGFVKGKTVTVVKNAPLKDPVEYSIMGYELSLRRNEAALIEVVTPEEAKKLVAEQSGEALTRFTEPELVSTGAKVSAKTINIALVGNPNAGKTTIFNHLSGLNEHVGNYGGVTVDSKNARFKYKGYTFHITDLPGTYSLTAYTPEEIFVRRHIHDSNPDVVINVIDSSNLERNLYLTSQLIDMDVRVIVALNMFDELQERGDSLDYAGLGRMLGIPFVPTVGAKAKGLQKLLDTTINVFAEKDKVVRHIHVNYGQPIEAAISAIQGEVRKNGAITVNYSSRYLSLKLIEKDRYAHEILANSENYGAVKVLTDRAIAKLEADYKEDTETLIADAKYGFIAGALKETFREGARHKRQTTEVIDTFITHKLFGFPIFLFLIWLTFYTTFTLGQYPMGWIEQGVELLGELANGIIPEGPFKDLVVNGVINGVGSVIVFLPNILILFFFISLLEDTGYMARAAFIMDKLMHKIGLHGKSFIPLVMGFGCNVPAIMASRTIENRDDRLVTMLITPFMSCSARLPVYVLILGAFFPGSAGNLLFLIYFIGILFAVLTALLLKSTVFRVNDAPFVMELPPYRIPTMRSTLMHMWHKGSQYLRKMGGIILVAVVIIWALGYFPRDAEYSRDFESEISLRGEQMRRMASALAVDSSALDSVASTIRHLEMQMEAERQAHSYLARIGRFVEPAIAPLGFDWRMGVSLLAGVAAKEIVVGTLGVLYQADEAEGSANSLAEKLRNETLIPGTPNGEKAFTPLKALSFLLFILIYFPCVAVISAVKNEAGSWRWAVFTIVFTTGLAWVVAFTVYQVGSLMGF